MFGFGSGKDNTPIVGAREKLMRAKMFKHGISYEDMQAQRISGSQNKRLAVSVMIVYGLSLVLSAVLTQATLARGNAPFHISDPFLDKLLLGTVPPQIIGDDMDNRLLVIFIRATFIFALGGLIPLCTKTWNRGRDAARANPYTSFWGVTIGIPCIVFLVRDFLGPFLISFFNVFVK